MRCGRGPNRSGRDRTHRYPASEAFAAAMSIAPPPLSVLLELTHRCPLACPYCSNPIALAALREEMDTAGWRSLLQQAADMGVLQAHFSGGEPMLR
ncbi:pyrroloquinoline quinone biosynthesis protein PqqE, partial [Xanthomonas perforans]